MILRAAQLDEVVPDAGDAAYDRHRKPGLFQDRALLDVQLNERLDVVPPGVRNARRIQPDLPHRFGDSLAAVAPHPVWIAGADPTGERARSPEAGRREPARLLLAEGNRLQRPSGLPELLLQGPQGHQRGDDTQGTVIPSARGLRIDVGTAHD